MSIVHNKCFEVSRCTTFSCEGDVVVLAVTCQPLEQNIPAKFEERCTTFRPYPHRVTRRSEPFFGHTRYYTNASIPLDHPSAIPSLLFRANGEELRVQLRPRNSEHGPNHNL